MITKFGKASVETKAQIPGPNLLDPAIGGAKVSFRGYIF